MLKHIYQTQKKMQTSRYLERALFYDETLAIHELYEKRIAQLFETKERSQVEVHLQYPAHIYNGACAPETWSADKQHWDLASERNPKLSQRIPADSCQNTNDHPRKNGVNLERFNISNIQGLKLLASVGLIGYSLERIHTQLLSIVIKALFSHVVSY